MARALAQSTVEEENVRLLREHALNFELIRFPDNAWIHKSLDARAEVRAFFAEAGIHDYDRQPAGDGRAVQVAALLLRKDGPPINTTLNLSKSNRPDRRLWLPALPQAATAKDLIAIVAGPESPIAINLSSGPVLELQGIGMVVRPDAESSTKALLLALIEREQQSGTVVALQGLISGSDVEQAISTLVDDGLLIVRGNEVRLTRGGIGVALELAVRPDDEEDRLDMVVGTGLEARFVPLERRSTKESPVRAIAPRLMRQVEAELVDGLEAALLARGHQVGRFAIWPANGGKPLFTDLADPDYPVLFEAKGSADRDSIRMAIGQLYDYRRYLPPDMKLAILLPVRPTPDLVVLLESLNIAIVVEGDLSRGSLRSILEGPEKVLDNRREQ